ncbi:MAG: Flp pilus assembly protein CpaB [Gemmatimonadetes bacterium]|nr:Flp pilus assembly protein CpaB [Gemmatimonadota bacterium]
MKNKRVWITLAGALGSGLLAGYLALAYVSVDPPTLIAAEPKGTQVVVASRDLPIGHIVSREDVEVVDWPSKNVPNGFYMQPGEVLGRGVMTTVHRNEPLLAAKLADKNAGGGMPLTIPDGKRAVSVEVDQVIGVAGFVLPGTRVDVLATVMPNANRSETTTRIILQNVPVLTADQSYQKDPNEDPKIVTVVTLLVSPEEAEALTLAATEGKIQLALRNMLDVDSVPTNGMRIEGLVRAAPRPKATATSSPVTPPQPKIVETYKGGSRTLLKFNSKGR